MPLSELAVTLRSPRLALGGLLVVMWSVVTLPSSMLFAGIGFGWILLALAWIDRKTMLLPDFLTLPLAVAGLAVILVIAPERMLDHVMGMAMGFVGLSLVSWGYRIVRRREGLGGGDAKLLGALGAWLGWQGLPSVLLLAAFGGLLAVLLQAMRGLPVRVDRPMPFGPWLCLGGWLVWLYGPLIPR